MTLMVKLGEQVAAQTVIGISGSTGRSGGPHLHFTLNRINDQQNYVVVNPYGWDDPDPDPWLEIHRPASEDMWIQYPAIQNRNSGGNFQCTAETTPYESGSALALPDSPDPRLTPDLTAATTYIIDDDETDPEFMVIGTWQTADCTATDCYDGDWHHVTNEGETAVWQPTADKLFAQEYDLYAYIPEGGTTFQASYRISHNGTTSWAGIRQNGFLDTRWAYLGRYAFNGNGGEFVRLTSVVDEGAIEVTAVDALAFVLVGDPPAPTPTPTPQTTPTVTHTPEPTPGVTTVTARIEQSSDDAGLHPSNCAFYTSLNEVYLGQCADGRPMISGLRFANLDIPQGSSIQDAYLEFTVDGTYSDPILVSFFGEASGNAQPFSGSSRPDNRPLTTANALWQVTDTWSLGDDDTSPDLRALVQEIVDRPDWSRGNAMAFIMTNSGTTGNMHRRVIGYDRVDPVRGYNGPDYAARLVITFAANSNPLPTPAATATAVATATSTPSPTATPQQTICYCAFLCLRTSSAHVPQTHKSGVLAALRQVQELTEFADLLYQLRDDVLSQTDEGQRYIAIYEEHSMEIATLLLANPELYDQGYETLQAFVPAIEAAVNGTGSSVTITAEQIALANTFLDALASAAGSGTLYDAIMQERNRVPVEQMVGMNVDDAWMFIQEYEPNEVMWQPPLVTDDPYEVQAGQTIAVKFRIEDANGTFVADDSVKLWLYEAGSGNVVAQVGAASHPNDGVKISNNQYHANLKTAVFAPGTYYLVVTTNSLPMGTVGEKTIVLRD